MTFRRAGPFAVLRAGSSGHGPYRRIPVIQRIVAAETRKPASFRSPAFSRSETGYAEISHVCKHQRGASPSQWVSEGAGGGTRTRKDFRSETWKESLQRV